MEVPMADNWPEGIRTNEYQLAVEYELAQAPGKLSPLVGQTSARKGKGAQLVDRFDNIDLEEKQSRHAPTPNGDVDVTRRWIKKPKSADRGTLIDLDDVDSTEVGMKSPIAVQTGNGVRRYHDDKWLQGYWGDGWTGENGDTSVPFTSGNIVPIAASGFTKAKLLLLREMMGLLDNDMEQEQPIVLLDVKSESDLLSIDEYVKVDYNDFKPLVRGEIKPWLGFRFVRVNLTSTRAFPVGSGLSIPGTDQVNLPAFFPSGLHRGVWREFFGRIGERADLSFDEQIYARACSAVVRTNEDKCFAIGVDHSP
jgi:hypothetical protein